VPLIRYRCCDGKIPSPWATQTHASTADTAESPLDLGDAVFGHPGLVAVPHAVRMQAEDLNAIVSYDDRLLKAATMRVWPPRLPGTDGKKGWPCSAR
jgi:hypothetical protein